jgi:predicted phosphodiesterase
MALAFIGDIHAAHYVLKHIDEELANRDDIKAYIQVGDLGLYPSHRQGFEKLKLSKPLYYIVGNHEWFPYYDGLTEVTEMFPNMFYVPNGSVMTLDNRVIGFYGGASSVDKEYQARKGRWFPQEVSTQEDADKLKRAVETVDLLVTHTCPQSTIEAYFDPMYLVYNFGLSKNWQDPVAHRVEELWNWFNHPSLICGHMHRPIQDRTIRILDINECIIR